MVQHTEQRLKGRNSCILASTCHVTLVSGLFPFIRMLQIKLSVALSMHTFITDNIFTKTAEGTEILGGNLVAFHLVFFFLNDDDTSAPSADNEGRNKQATSRHFQGSFHPTENGIWTGSVYFLFTDCRGSSRVYSKFLVFRELLFLKWLFATKIYFKWWQLLAIVLCILDEILVQSTYILFYGVKKEYDSNQYT